MLNPVPFFARKRPSIRPQTAETPAQSTMRGCLPSMHLNKRYCRNCKFSFILQQSLFSVDCYCYFFKIVIMGNPQRDSIQPLMEQTFLIFTFIQNGPSVFQQFLTKFPILLYFHLGRPTAIREALIIVVSYNRIKPFCRFTKLGNRDNIRNRGIKDNNCNKSENTNYDYSFLFHISRLSLIACCSHYFSYTVSEKHQYQRKNQYN